MARVVRFHAFGGPEVLRIDELDLRRPNAGEVVIKVAAIGLNRVETMFRSGNFVRPTLPSKIGYEAAGAITAVGEGVADFKVGDRVATLPGLSMEEYGTNADAIIYPANMLVKVPTSLSFVQAAAAWMQYLTAYAIIGIAHVKPGDAVVITAASSSVGLAAIQMANAEGAIPIALTRDASKADALRKLGAKHVIVTDKQSPVAEIMQATGGYGARIIFDCVGGDALSMLLESAAFRGILINYGALAGHISPVPIFTMMGKALAIHGYSMNHLIADESERPRALAYVSAGLANGSLNPIIDRQFAFADIVNAHRYLEGNAQIGKIVVTVP